MELIKGLFTMWQSKRQLKRYALGITCGLLSLMLLPLFLLAIPGLAVFFICGTIIENLPNR